MALTDQTVLVTGAAGGLGTAICQAFIEQGAQLVVTDYDIAAAEQLCKSLGDRALAARLDVSREDEWQAVMDLAKAHFGGVQVVVNNAGFYRPNVNFEDMSLDLWRRHFQINADGVFLGSRFGIAAMKETGGAIVNIGSGMSITANPMGSAYCASKAAVLMTTRTAAASAGKYNIRVNAVLPGAVPTDMLRGNLVEGQSEEDMLSGLSAYSPLGRLAMPEDIARGVVFLADPANSAIAGVYLPIDGGNMPGA